MTNFVEIKEDLGSHRAQLGIGIGLDSAVIVGDVPGCAGGACGWRGNQIVRVRVENVDARQTYIWPRASRGPSGTVSETPAEREHGERDYLVEDVADHRWSLCDTTRDIAPDQFGCETGSPWPDQWA